MEKVIFFPLKWKLDRGMPWAPPKNVNTKVRVGSLSHPRVWCQPERNWRQNKQFINSRTAPSPMIPISILRKWWGFSAEMPVVRFFHFHGGMVERSLRPNPKPGKNIRPTLYTRTFVARGLLSAWYEIKKCFSLQESHSNIFNAPLGVPTPSVS